MKLLVIDNYDSFTFNLVQYLGELGAESDVVRNDAITVEQVGDRGADAIVISPGPCTPKEAGISVDTVRSWAGRLPILGVCLGHQSVAAAYGGQIVPAKTLMHGKTSMIAHDGRGIFAGLPDPFEATRYHSLAVAPDSLPDVLEVSATTPDGEIMGLRHREVTVIGVQFHPESILTGEGKHLLRNFLDIARKGTPA
ncbi:MAG: aminodeoxychorismate/anthranilate synthase component II [Deltaproteobacteria bacterium]|nr:aminodeoxychorismate/anthranilate synthase component II [Deltaproteobacteria bacterium]MBW2413052.1 aminodeoxychorismate/anthranilate synthase component II [Deltaproteobacteria bacterium]